VSYPYDVVVFLWRVLNSPEWQRPIFVLLFVSPYTLVPWLLLLPLIPALLRLFLRVLLCLFLRVLLSPLLCPLLCPPLPRLLPLLLPLLLVALRVPLIPPLLPPALYLALHPLYGRPLSSNSLLSYHWLIVFAVAVYRLARQPMKEICVYSQGFFGLWWEILT
jgi:hypothetical protein